MISGIRRRAVPSPLSNQQGEPALKEGPLTCPCALQLA